MARGEAKFRIQRKKRGREPKTCDVWDANEGCRCDERVFLWGFCKSHFESLKKDDLYETFKAMSHEQRMKALGMLHEARSQRPAQHWQYEGHEDELIALQEKNR